MIDVTKSSAKMMKKGNSRISARRLICFLGCGVPPPPASGIAVAMTPSSSSTCATWAQSWVSWRSRLGEVGIGLRWREVQARTSFMVCGEE